ncbi:hypothetical protein [Longimicrobium terrae]|uniref:Uncharacterized protein n=1 Tax=Longimicrobium terrae TaxID=1639882 RepID=A0A841H4C7_9BACT|nr:hypothetical protein [Longimicrobium terrae]MBB4638539.1 hypothetical protein [Longimicrobium terrae]MBB6072823.1 hypothetical protein [Longimicrobium terrae]NNC30560.1 hypothetical protein [Longimicrobium terrae]
MRQFRDADGAEWVAWEVIPVNASLLERRGISPAGGEEYAGPDRRGEGSRTLKEGWLAFESGDRKRRLAPVPPGWQECSEEDLRALLARAAPVRRRPAS